MKICIRKIPGVVVILFTITACTTQSTQAVAIKEGHPDLYFVRGYRSDNDPCKLTGETDFTNKFLDDSADLVSCPTGHDSAKELLKTRHAIVVTQTKGYTLYSVHKP